MKQSIAVRIPASTSNLGSGFDTLGLAVDLHNEFVLQAGDHGARILSPISNDHRAGMERLLQDAASEFFQRANVSPFGVAVSWNSNIPIARGLGFSATLRLGVIAALNEMAGAGLGKQQLLEIVTLLEGHPDNASPAIFGGFTVSGTVGRSQTSSAQVRCLRFQVSPILKLITLIPNVRISTEEARRLLPKSLSRQDAAHGLNRAALITAAFAREDYLALRGLFDDPIHQPYREPLIPQLSRVIRAGEQAGAIGGFLSGSGSAIICLTLDNPEEVARAMQKELPDSEVKILTGDNDGFQLK